MLPFVSVVTPTRNRRGFVPMLLRLFRAQTWPADRLELVLADDGDDPVGDLVADDPRVQYVRSRRRLTIGAKRNLCASVARGEILVHMDDDDWYPADRVSAIQYVEAFEVCEYGSQPNKTELKRLFPFFD